MKKLAFRAVAASISILLAALASVDAAPLLGSVQIASRTTAMPGDYRTFDEFGPPAMDGSTIVFSGRSVSSSTELRQSGIYAKSSGQSLQRVVDTSTPFPGISGTFTSFREPAVDNGKIIFWGQSGPQHGALMEVNQSGELDYVRLNDGSVINQNTLMPGTGGTLPAGTSVEVVAGDGNIAFIASTYIEGTGFRKGLYAVIDGELSAIADANTQIPGTSGTFETTPPIGIPSIDGDTVAFVAGSGVYAKSGSGELQTIVDQTTAVPDGSGNFQTFVTRLAVEGDKVYFTGTGEADQFGVYEATIGGTITSLVNQDTPVTGVNPDWTFGPGGTLSVDNGNLVFHGSETPDGINPVTRRGLYAIVDGQPAELLSTSARGDYSTSQDSLSGNLVGYEASFASTGTDQVLIGRIGKVPEAQTVTQTTTSLPNQGRHLVVVTHGWIGPQTTHEETLTWVHAMTDSIQDQLSLRAGTNSSDWDVVPYVWLDGADTALSPALALANGATQGKLLGNQIYEGGYDFVHFIGHSAGAGLITAAANTLEGLKADITIHSTFLDPYKPWAPRGDYLTNEYGAASDWADNYLSDDILLLDPILKLTNPVLDAAHNVDVDGLNKLNSPEDKYQGHAGPREFYADSVYSPEIPDFEGYGFKLSKEYLQDDWNPQLIRGNDPPIVLGGGTWQTGEQSEIMVEDFIDFTALLLNKSETGSVVIDNSGFLLQTGSPVWMTSSLDLSIYADFLTFGYEFMSDAGADGVFSVYLDDLLLGTIDERYELAGRHEQIFYFNQIEPGIHTLGFRLDPYGTQASSIRISDVRFGGFAESSVTVPEPSTVILLLIGMLSVVLRTNVSRGRSPAPVE